MPVTGLQQRRGRLQSASRGSRRPFTLVRAGSGSCVRRSGLDLWRLGVGVGLIDQDACLLCLNGFGAVLWRLCLLNSKPSSLKPRALTLNCSCEVVLSALGFCRSRIQQLGPHLVLLRTFMLGFPSSRTGWCQRCRLQLLLVLQPLMTLLRKPMPTAVRKLYLLWDRDRSN